MSVIKCLVIGIPVSCVGIAVWWSVKKYRESKTDLSSSNPGNEIKPKLVSEAKTGTAPASKGHAGVEQDIIGDNGNLVDSKMQ
jgi:hypothetical protein